MKTRLVSLGTLALVVMLLLTLGSSCGKGQSTPTPTTKTMKIGILQPLSGPAASWGTNVEKGAKWAVENINAAGGLKVGNETYELETASCDTQYIGSEDPTGLGNEAANCAISFVDQEGIHYVVGPILTADVVDPTFTAAKTFYATQGTVPCNASMPYRIVATATVKGWVDAWWQMTHAHHPEVKTVALINPQGSIGDSWQQAAATYGLTVVAQERYDPGAAGFYPEGFVPILTRVVAKNPDAIDFGSASPEDAALMTKEVRDMGYGGWLYQPAMTDTALLLQVAGADNMTKIASNQPDWTSSVYPAKAQQLYAQWQQKYPGQPMDRTVVMGYSTVSFYVSAIERAGSIDPARVMTVLNDPAFTFETFFADSASLGGTETFGIRRQWPLNCDYGEIIDANHISLSMDMVLVETP